LSLPKRDLTRVDADGDTAGLPPSLVDAIEAAGGLWWAGDAYTTREQVVSTARRMGVTALRLDFRDLSLLEELPDVRYLHVRSDGRPRLDPVRSLGGLRALIIETSALTGQLDPLGFAELRWLRVGLGGKGGEAILPSIQRGHPHLEWLALRETRARRAADLCAGFPRLRVLHISYADSLRELGRLADVTPDLEKISLFMTAALSSLSGLEGLARLQTVAFAGGRVTDLDALHRLPALRHARLELPRVESIEGLRGHPSLRMVLLNVDPAADLSVLDSIPNLVAVGRGPRLDRELRWPDVLTLARDHPLRLEWSRAMQE
jgi:hypothetical protein